MYKRQLIEGLDVEANKDIDYPLCYWLDKLYIPSGTNSLYEYDIASGDVEILSPVKFAIGDTRYDGKVIALASDGLEYLYVAVKTLSRCIILAGRWETVGSETDWRWHPIYDGTDSTESISQMLVSNALGKKLYIGNYNLPGSTSPTGYNDPEDAWVYETGAYDGNVYTYFGSQPGAWSWSEFVEFTTPSISCDHIAYYGHDTYNSFGQQVDIDVYYNSAWHDVYQDDYEKTGWHNHSIGGTYSVTKMRIRGYTSSSQWIRFFEVMFGVDILYWLQDIALPISYTDPLSESSYEVVSSGDFITPWYRTSFSSLDKYFQELQVTSKCRTDGDIAVYYQLKGAGDPDDTDNWTLLGRVTQNDVISGNYPEEWTDNFLIDKASERIRFKFSLSTDDSSYSPIIYGEGGGIHLSSRIAGKVRSISMTLKIGTNRVTSSAGISNKTIAEQLQIVEMLDESSEPLILTGLDGVKRSVLFDATGLTESPYKIGTLDEEWRVNCVCLEAK